MLDNYPPSVLLLNQMNTRQHRFVLNLFQGMNQGEAYMKAGYNVQDSAVAQSNASQLVRNSEVIKELERLEAKRDAIVTANEINSCLSKNEKRSILAEIARARLVDFSKDGEPALTENTPNNRAAREYYHKTRYDKRGNPSVSKSIKLINPIEAIAEDNKMEGHYAPSKHMVAKEVRLNVSFGRKGRVTEE